MYGALENQRRKNDLHQNHYELRIVIESCETKLGNGKVVLHDQTTNNATHLFGGPKNEFISS